MRRRIRRTRIFLFRVDDCPHGIVVESAEEIDKLGLSLMTCSAKTSETSKRTGRRYIYIYQGCAFRFFSLSFLPFMPLGFFRRRFCLDNTPSYLYVDGATESAI